MMIGNWNRRELVAGKQNINLQTSGRGDLPRCLAVFAVMVACAGSALAAANVTVTKATGGSAISADTAGSTYTPLSGPTLTESAAGTIGTGTLILHAPAG